MAYTVHQLSKLAGVSVRTLHYYDAIGLLKPSRTRSNGYRHYEEGDLLKLQQILFFRELEFPLEEIKKILDNPTFDMMDALSKHRKVIENKKKRMKVLLETIDKTLDRIQTKKQMKAEELYDGFSKEEAEAYAKEAKERWGHTEAYRQSVGKYDKLTNEEKKMMQKKADQLMHDIVDTMSKGVHHAEVQRLIAQHYDNLRFFYEPNTEMYRNLGIMYVEDKRFAAYFEKYHPALPEFMKDAMAVYCDMKEGKLWK